MKPSGWKAIEAAKADGRWENAILEMIAKGKMIHPQI